VVKVIITPTSGTVGTIVTVNGEGFGSREGVRVDFGENGDSTLFFLLKIGCCPHFPQNENCC